MALNDDLTLVLGHVDDTKLPVTFRLLNTCTGENIDAEVFLIGGAKVGDVHISNNRTTGGVQGSEVTVNINLSSIPIGDAYSLKFSTTNAGVVGKSKLVVFAEDAFSTKPLTSAGTDFILNSLSGGLVTVYKANVQYASGPVVVVHNNDLYLYLGAFPFTTTNITNELASGLWKNVLNLDTETLQDLIGAMVSSNTETGIAVTYDDTNGKLNFDVGDFTITQTGDTTGTVTVTNLANATLNSTLATVNSNVGSFGSTTAIPILTVNAKGLVTGVSTATISTVLTLAADSGSNDNVTIGTDTLTIAGGTGLDTTISNNNISVAIDSTVATLTGSQTLTNKTLTSPTLNSNTNIGSGGIINFGSNKISISGDAIEKKG